MSSTSFRSLLFPFLFLFFLERIPNPGYNKIIYYDSSFFFWVVAENNILFHIESKILIMIIVLLKKIFISREKIENPLYFHDTKIIYLYTLYLYIYVDETDESGGRLSALPTHAS